MFDQVDLHTNVGKTMSMACRPCREIGGNSTEVYTLRMNVEGITYQERLLLRVRCHECDTDLAAGSLETHQQVQHGVSRGDLIEIPPTTPHPPDVTRKYWISFPWAAREITCLVG